MKAEPGWREALERALRERKGELDFLRDHDRGLTRSEGKEGSPREPRDA